MRLRRCGEIASSWASSGSERSGVGCGRASAVLPWRWRCSSQWSGACAHAVGLIADAGGWPLGLIAPLLYAGGVGHACAYSPLTNRMAATVHPGQTSDLSGLLLTASLIGQVLGIAAFVGVFLDAAPHGPAHALALTTGAIAAALIVTAACAYKALTHHHTPRSAVAHAEVAECSQEAMGRVGVEPTRDGLWGPDLQSSLL
jgi:hypothetical protein